MQLSFSPLLSAIRGEAFQPHIAGLRAALEGSRMKDLLYRRVAPVHPSSNFRKSHSSRLSSSAGDPEEAQASQRYIKDETKQGSTFSPRPTDSPRIGRNVGRRGSSEDRLPPKERLNKAASRSGSTLQPGPSTSTSSRRSSPSRPYPGPSSAPWESSRSQSRSPKPTSPIPAQPQCSPPEPAQPRGSSSFQGNKRRQQQPRNGSSNAGQPDPALVKGIKSMKDEQRPVRPNVHLEKLNDEMMKFFENRKISEKTLKRFEVQMAPNVYNAPGGSLHAIAFPYKRNGEMVNVKYRTLTKKFWQEKNAEKILFGYDQVVEKYGPHPPELIIVEGEMDVLALHEAGYDNVVSVPDGAPAVAKASTPLSATKFSYLGASWSLLEGVQKFVIATDNDNPGNALAEELMRRLNRELCWRVRWSKAGPPTASTAPVAHEEDVTLSQAQEAQPAGDDSSVLDSKEHFEDGAPIVADSSYRKDGNDVLIQDGKEAVKQRVGDAEPSPIVGLYRFDSYLEDILAQYHNEDEQGVAYTTGWDTLDPIYKVVLGEVTIVSGVPNSGKSEWIDALLMNLSMNHGWAFALCSLEKTPDKHAIQLIEKCQDKPFYDRWDYDYRGEWDGDELVGGRVDRMSEGEVLEGLRWINDRFQIISNVGSDFPTIDWILDKARSAVLRHGIHGLVIDPYNEINHARPRDMNETEYVSIMMSKVKRFAQMYDVAVWFVAHPRQQQAWAGGAPDMYCISGSAHFVNKADNVIMVHRPYQPKAGLGQDSKGSKQQDLLPNEVQIYMCKVRNKLAGTRSEEPARLAYDRVSGMYYDDPQRIAEKMLQRERSGQYSWFKRSSGDVIASKDLQSTDGFGQDGEGLSDEEEYDEWRVEEEDEDPDRQAFMRDTVVS